MSDMVSDLYYMTQRRPTDEVTIRFLERLQAEFEEKLVVLLNQATYFTAKTVKDLAADEPIELVYFPTGSLNLNPTEEYYRRLNTHLNVNSRN